MQSSNLIFIIIALLLVIIAMLAAGIIYLTKQKNNQLTQPNTDSAEAPTIIEEYKVENCSHHSDRRAMATCAICSTPLCESCITPDNKLNFCREHIDLYQKNEWVEVTTIKSYADDPHLAVGLYQTKEFFWKNEGKPSIIRTRYKIDIENDRIESHISLHTIEDFKGEFNQKLHLN